MCIGVTIPLSIGSKSGSRIPKKLKIRLRIRFQGRNHITSNLQVVRERHQHGDDASEGARRLPLGEEGGDHEGEHDEGEAEDLADEEDDAEADALDDDELGDQGDEEGDEGDHHRVDHEPREPKYWVIIQGCR